jgi:hypothetical protein
VLDKYAYLLGSNNLYIIEINDTLDHKIIGTYNFGENQAGGEVHVSKNYAYIASTKIDTLDTQRQLNLLILDISDPAHPTEVGSLNQLLRGYWVADMYVYYNYAYVAKGPDGLSIIDLSDVSHPEEITSYHTGGGVGAFTVAGNYTLVDNGQFGGISIVNSKDPENLRMINFIPSSITVSDIIALGNYAYIIGTSFDWSTGFLSILDITNPMNPTELALLDLGEWPVSFQISDNFAYIIMHRGELRIFDLTNPIQIEEVSSNQVLSWGGRILVSDNLAYIGGAYGGGWVQSIAVLVIVDIHDPLNPVILDSLGINLGTINHLAISNNYLYVSGSWHDPFEGMYGGNWFYIIDISDPSKPSIVDTLDFRINDICISKNNLYLTTANGLEIYDTKNPFNLRKIGNYPIRSAGAVSVSDDVIFVSGPGVLYTLKADLSTKIDGKSKTVTSFYLKQNYPNPFNPTTKIRYSVPQTSQVVIKVLDILGNEIETLVNEEKPAGTFELTWNASNLPSGVYFYRIQVYPTNGGTGNFVETKKLLFLK